MTEKAASFLLTVQASGNKYKCSIVKDYRGFDNTPNRIVHVFPSCPWSSDAALLCSALDDGVVVKVVGAGGCTVV